ncbi:MAG: Veg family protein [bacterium]|nr:Veg family protein [bacterium]
MTIEKIKTEIKKKIGDDVKVTCKGSRNKKEEFEGKITEMYNAIFIVKVGNSEVKSFCYSDILTNTVQLNFSHKKKS